ncbi:MAG: pyruvate formate lyase family protein [Oscillospiraceae bacterium]
MRARRQYARSRSVDLFCLSCRNKEQNAAMSLGRVGTFLDIFIERDLKAIS